MNPKTGQRPRNDLDTLAQVDQLQPQLTRKDITETAIFKICEDLDVRLAINQGYTRPSDYRDAL